MADTWTTPIKDWATGAILAESDLDAEVRDRAEVLANAIDGDTSASTIKHRHKAGNYADMGAAGESGRLYIATDMGAAFVDDGTNWHFAFHIPILGEYFFDDFVAGLSMWATGTSGSGAVNLSDSDESFVRMSTGATNGSRVRVIPKSDGQAWWKVGATRVPALWQARARSTSSTAQTIAIGAAAAFPSSHGVDSADCIYFRRFDAGSAVNWFAVVRSGGADVSGSPVDTGILGDTSFHKFKIEVLGTASAKFYIDDILKATISATLPTATVQSGFSILNNTTADRVLEPDYMLWLANRV